MAIITTYPFKKAPLNKKDEIMISDAASNNPNFKTKTTDVDTISKFVVSISNFVFNQSIASATWVVQHDLNKFPSVTVVDSNKDIVYGNVRYNTLNTLTITFSAPFSGQAYMN